MKIWVVVSSGDVTAWSSRAKAVELLVRDQLESSKRDLAIYEQDQVRYRAWLDWFDGKGPRPERTVWEVERLDQNPGWAKRPEIMAELRLSISSRQQNEAKHLDRTRERIAGLEKGIPYEGWGDNVFEWTLDDPEPQAFEDWD